MGYSSTVDQSFFRNDDRGNRQEMTKIKSKLDKDQTENESSKGKDRRFKMLVQISVRRKVE